MKLTLAVVTSCAAMMLPSAAFAQEQGAGAPPTVQAPSATPQQPNPYPYAGAPQQPSQQPNPYAYPAAPQQPPAYPGAYPQNPYPPPAPAATPSNTYLAVRLGALIPKHKDLEGFDNGFAVEGAVGFRPNENIGLELSIGRFSMSAEGQDYISGVLANIKTDIVAYPVLATLRLVLPVDKLELFGLAGGGIYFMSAEGEATAPGYMPLTASDSDTPFGFHFGGGVNVRVAPHALIGAEVKYIIGKANIWDSSNGFDSITVGGGVTFHL